MSGRLSAPEWPIVGLFGRALDALTLVPIINRRPLP